MLNPLNAIDEYLNEKWSLESLREHMVNLRINRFQSLSRFSQVVINEFECRYAQLAGGAITEEQFKSTFKELLN
jgi:hypothetical protein